MTSETINSGLVQNILSPTSLSHQQRMTRIHFFNLCFVEYFKPLPKVDHPVPEVPTPVPATLTSSPSSTTIDQDAPSTSTLQTTSEQQSLVIPQGVEDDFYDIEVAHMDNDHYFGILILEPSSEETTLRENVIGDSSRPVLTRSQLQEHAIWYYSDVNDNPIPFGGIVSSDVEFFALEPPVRDTNKLMNELISPVCQNSLYSSGSWLRIEELRAVLTLKHLNHVFSSYLDLNLVEVEEGQAGSDPGKTPESRPPQDKNSWTKTRLDQTLKRLKSFVEYYMFRKRFVRATLEHPLMKNLFHVSFGQFSEAISKSANFLSSDVTRVANSESLELYCCGGGGSGRVVVVVVVVAVKIGA
nr:hypothetical protein [Tanacetum cinerariifolium]